MVMGIDAFERSEHEKSIANKAKEQAYLPPHSMNELSAGQSGSVYEPYIMEVACGPMGWIVDLTCKDSSPRMRSADHGSWMIEYARSLVWAYGIANAGEAIETILQMWETGFQTGKFDRVNLSYVGGLTPDEAFSRLFKELVRLCRSGGTICWMEGTLPVTNSRACRQLCALSVQAMEKAGRSFYREKPELSFYAVMEMYLREAGCRTIRYIPIRIDVSAGSVVQATFVQVMLSTAKILKPFLLWMHLLTDEEHTQLMKQMRKELWEPMFHGACYLYVVWGSV